MNNPGLGPDGQALPKATLILTNPPFGTKRGGGRPSRADFAFPTSNKQLCFLQHVYGALHPGGRAAVVVPDNVLFEGNVAKQIRTDLMEKCNLHTILRLPTGIFYAQAVKTNVLFFTRGTAPKGNTQNTWVYDLRTNTAQFGRRTALTREHFSHFEATYGDDPLGIQEHLRRRNDEGESGRFRKFGRAWIAQRGDNLDISWRPYSPAPSDDIPNPAVLASAAIDDLQAAVLEFRHILHELANEPDNDPPS